MSGSWLDQLQPASLHVHEPGARTACACDMCLRRGTLRVRTQPATALLIGADAGAG